MLSENLDPGAQIEAAQATLADNPSEPRKSKQVLLLKLIGQEGGATLNELSASTGWLPHTARAAITRLRKRGHDVQRERVGGVSRYIVVESAGE